MKYVLMVTATLGLVCTVCEANVGHRLAKAQHKVAKLQARTANRSSLLIIHHRSTVATPTPQPQPEYRATPDVVQPQ